MDDVARFRMKSFEHGGTHPLLLQIRDGESDAEALFRYDRDEAAKSPKGAAICTTCCRPRFVCAGDPSTCEVRRRMRQKMEDTRPPIAPFQVWRQETLNATMLLAIDGGFAAFTLKRVPLEAVEQGWSCIGLVSSAGAIVLLGGSYSLPFFGVGTITHLLAEHRVRIRCDIPRWGLARTLDLHVDELADWMPQPGVDLFCCPGCFSVPRPPASLASSSVASPASRDLAAPRVIAHRTGCPIAAMRGGA